MDFPAVVAAAIADLRAASGLVAVWKDADPACDALFPDIVRRHGGKACLAAKATAAGMARCRLADDWDEARWRGVGWMPQWRTCHAGVCELVLAVREGGTFLGTLFVGGGRVRAQAEAAGRLAAAVIAGAAAARAPALARARAAGHAAVLAALALLERRPDARLRAAAVARSVGLSRCRFAHAFSAAVGEPFARYRARRVAAEAARLLAGGDLPVAAIAERLGYASPEYLAHAFRRHHGCAPLAFRRRARESPP